jgi:hypothetical protein
MTVRVKNGDIGGGTWVTVGDGKFAFKSTSAGWTYPTSVKVKNGDIGGGSWVDAGYVGYPAVPTGLAVNAWTYTSASVKWSAGAGGAAVSSYEVDLLNSGGGVIQTVTDTGSPSSTFSLSQDTRYQFRVRAKSAAGLPSAYTPNLRIETGHASTYYETTEPTSAPWSAALSVNGYKDALVGPAVPSSVVCTSVRYQIYANGGFTAVLSPYGNREIYRLANSGLQERFTWNAGSVDVTVDVADYWGNGGITGMICRGSGWATGPDTHIARAVGTITAIGTHYYTYQLGHTTPAEANSYW